MRTQIHLESEQHALAKRKAGDLGISMAEYIRRLVEQCSVSAFTRRSHLIRTISFTGSAETAAKPSRSTPNPPQSTSASVFGH